jgi:putative transposase
MAPSSGDDADRRVGDRASVVGEFLVGDAADGGSMRMQHSRFTEQQIAFVLDQVARGVSIEQTCRAAGIPVQTYYRWRTKYAGMKPADIRHLHEIEEENKRLKRLLASLLVVKPAPKDTPLQLPAPIPATASAVPATGTLAANRYWSALADYLPKRQSLDVRGHGRALWKQVHDWASAHAKERHSYASGDLKGRLLAWPLKIWRTRKLLLVCFAAGLIAGFAIGLSPTTTIDDEAQAVPVNLDLRFNGYSGLASSLDKGWSRQQDWGRWMERGTATVLLGFDGPARGDVQLLVEARARLAKGQPDETLIVRFNDAELGRWQLPQRDGQLRRRFIVPRDVFNRDTAGRLEFVLDGKPPLTPVFGLEAMSMRDARFLHDYRGFVDSCSNGELVGWAVAEGVPVTVAASVAGKPLSYAQTNRERPDLAAHGLPEGAGFSLKLAEPVSAGTAIDVRFANGQPLIGSPCKP